MTSGKRKYSEDIVRHAFDEALNALSRLSAFATSKPREDGPIDSRQERLALDDLVTFAVHARRLVQNTVGKQSFDSVIIKQLEPLHGSIAIMHVLDALIHNEDVQVIRSFLQYGFIKDPPINQDEGIRRLAEHGHEHTSIPPIIAVKSDRGLRCVVYVGDLTDSFETQVLSRIIEYCADDQFFLEDYLRDP
jgi:hypothetical protein